MGNSEPSPSVLILYPDLDHIAFYRCTYLPLETKEPTVKIPDFQRKACVQSRHPTSQYKTSKI
jgi:hypothetical protein